MPTETRLEQLIDETARIKSIFILAVFFDGVLQKNACFISRLT